MSDTKHICLEYPRIEGREKYIEIDLEDVRASDGIRISYDFDRDGWKIEQASKFEFNECESIDYDYQEVAFVKSWAREVNKEKP